MKKGWRTEKLSSVCEKITDGTHKTPKYFDTGVLFLSSRNVTTGEIDWGDVKYIDEAQHTEMQRRVSPRLNDILLAKNGTTGVAALVDRDVQFDIYVSLALLRPKEVIHPKFLLHFINSPLAKEQFTKRLKGIGVPNLHLEEIREVELSFPESRAEQQRIVSILDEAFDGLATAKANAEKNLQNARALFESHLQSVFTQRGDGWVESTIGEHIRFIDYRGKTPEKTASGLRLITAKNVKMGYLQEKPMEFVAPKSYDAWMTRGIPRIGDVLFTTEAPLANVAQLDTDEKVVFAQRIIIMQPDAQLDSTFLKYLLLSQPVQQRIRTKGTGATVQGIKASLLRTIEISFPSSLALQRKIVSKLDSLREETQRLESIYQQKLAALDELKKSLLHQAFNGELTGDNGQLTKDNG